jgi:hypothetical protein
LSLEYQALKEEKKRIEKVRQEAKREKKCKEERQGRDEFEDNRVICMVTTRDTIALNNAYPGPDSTSHNDETKSEEETMLGEP